MRDRRGVYSASPLTGGTHAASPGKRSVTAGLKGTSGRKAEGEPGLDSVTSSDPVAQDDPGAVPGEPAATGETADAPTEAPRIPRLDLKPIARKAISFSLVESFASSGVGEAMRGEPSGAATSPSEVAEEGFRGSPVGLPFRGELERSFGVSFSNVLAYTDVQAQQAAAKLNAKAYTSGNRVAFGTPNPDKALVAHELTHVLQHTGQGPAKKSDNSGSGGIETSGEAEAEQVEAAVASGKPALSALSGGEVGTKGDAGPALKANQLPARSGEPKFGVGMTFSPTGFEKSGTYTLWKPSKGHEIRVPIAAVPGLNFMVDPLVWVKVASGADWKHKMVASSVAVEGMVGVGLSYGESAIAEVYADLEASARGGFTYERTRHEPPKANTWSLDGGITLATDFAVGVKLGGGMLDTKFTFGHCDIGSVTGVAWKNGHFERDKIGWEWGSQPKAFFAKLKALIAKVRHILNLGPELAKKGWNDLKSGVGGIADMGGVVVGGIANGIKSVLKHIPNPF